MFLLKFQLQLKMYPCFLFWSLKLSSFGLSGLSPNSEFIKKVCDVPLGKDVDWFELNIGLDSSLAGLEGAERASCMSGEQ